MKRKRGPELYLDKSFKPCEEKIFILSFWHIINMIKIIFGIPIESRSDVMRQLLKPEIFKEWVKLKKDLFKHVGEEQSTRFISLFSAYIGCFRGITRPSLREKINIFFDFVLRKACTKRFPSMFTEYININERERSMISVEAVKKIIDTLLSTDTNGFGICQTKKDDQEAMG